MTGQKWQCRIAPSLGGGFAGNPYDCWGVKEYKDENAPTVFMGLYSLKDFMVLNNHKGRRAVFFCGSDIRHLRDGYWLDDKGEIRIPPTPIARWINDNCESWCENDIEQSALRSLGIESKICPSFLGDVNKFYASFKPGNKAYSSVSGDDFKLYGWDRIEEIAAQNPDLEIHLFGNIKEWKTDNSNVKVHGRVSQERFDKETREMQGALRLVEFEGFSEIVAKSLLWGQYPVSAIKYPHTLNISEIRDILGKKQPNLEGRKWVLDNVNKFPWNTK